MGIGSFFENLVGDVTKGVEEVVPGARNIDRFLNKAGIGPADFGDNPFKPKGWVGDLEHAYSQFTHIPAIRDSQFAAAAILAAMYAPEALPYFASAAGTGDAAVSAADMSAMMDAGSADVAAMGSEATAATSADIAASTDATMAAQTADLAGTPLETAPLNPSQLFAQANPDINPLTYTGGAMPGVPVAPGIGTDAIPALANPMDVSISDPMSGMAPGFQPGGGFVPPDPSSGDLAQPSTWSKWADYLTSPKGALTATSLGASLYSLMNSAKLPGYAQQAGAAAGPASAQAQVMLASGGQGSPLWGQQKAAIDAQIDQQIQNFSRAVQQNAQNSGQGGSNSMVVQQQIQQATQSLEAQRQQMYMAAQQQNVSNAVAELTGANQTLMSLANLQFQEDQAAQQLSRSIGLTTGQLASLWPSSTPSG